MAPALRRGPLGLALLACLAAAPPAPAQVRPERNGGVARTAGPVFPAPTVARDDPSVPFGGGLPSAPREFPRAGAPPAHASATATFAITYSGFPEEARLAFQVAADRWAEHISSPVPIRVDARWVALGPNILGSAGPFLVRDFSGAPLSSTWYPDALADAVAGRDLNPAGFDIRATFNAAFDRWHFDPTTPPPADRYDLATIVLHELGHGLGFIGSMDVEGGQGVFGSESPGSGDEDGIPFIYDRRTEDAAGRPLIDYGSPSVPLAAALQAPMFFDGPAARALLNDRVALYGPAAWAPGTSYSHLDEATFPEGSQQALMTPFFAQAERITAPDAPACAVLIDIGWLAGAGCAALVPGVEPPPDDGATLALAPLAPNPSRAGTRATLTVARTQFVRVALYDAAGRRVATLFDGEAVGGEGLLLHVPPAAAAGVYFVRADGDRFTEALAVTLLR